MGGRGFVAECGAGAEELAKVGQRVKDEEGSPRGELAPAGRLRGACCLYAFLANPSPSSLRDATSPQGEAFPLRPAQFKTCKAMDCVVY